MASKFPIPKTIGEKCNEIKDDHVLPDLESNVWYNKEHDEKLKKDFFWSTPYDARFPQIRKQRQCFTYYVDFFRCQNLMGEDYEPCKFFQNVYKDFCPNFWVEKWDELREEGRFPAKFDR
ncbi:Cytochrome c oxidase subunit 6B1 [Strongyloides ratti]|uniref:Cytochrome c oxidase subunit 6B1 n=1 Tax=Strongyloides ratti TaxID=34506 RepID=A0A090L3J2_STRRB|nr:Cytochrome c oxidase subunit 6B1 [Strongyloides ratti]CEF64376.1 Cytochrome c oxidase subunit 6B1 [Strongyloides ratti]